MASSIITPIGILAFPQFFSARAAVAGAEPRFSGLLVFDEETQKAPEYIALKRAVFQTGVDEWGADKMKDPNFLRRLRLPFRDAKEKDYAGFDPGKIFISAWTKNKPGVVNERVQEITVPDDVWSGQLARFYVRPFTYSQSGNTGISLALEHVQITKSDMPRIDGRKAASDVFTPTVPADQGGGGAGQPFDDTPF